MPGVVTEYLTQLIRRQVEERGLVVWYDPEKAFGETVSELQQLGSSGMPFPISAYDGSFLQLRKSVDHLLNDHQPPRLVVYVPIERTETNSALIELDFAGVIMQPRQQPPACNTRLSVVARNALKPILGEDQIGEIERQVEAGKLTLSDLDSLGEKGQDISTGVMTLIFGSANPQDVALAFLNGEQFDNEITKKDAKIELQRMLQFSFEIELPVAGSLSDWRTKMGRHILMTDLFSIFKENVSSFSSVSMAKGSSGVDACVRLAKTWRNRRDMRDSYIALALIVEQDVLQQGNWQAIYDESKAKAVDSPSGKSDTSAISEHRTHSGEKSASLTASETFLCNEYQLLRYVETELVGGASVALLKTAEDRMSKFWADAMPAIQSRWALVCSAAEVLILADSVGKSIKNAPGTVLGMIDSYTEGEEPWCLLDTHHRHMESRKYNFEFSAGDDHRHLEKLITKAEQRYTEVGSELSRSFIQKFQAAKHPIKGVFRQRDIYERKVRPLLIDGKVAYIWVDALRYEMARELCRLLKDDFKLELTSAIATMPTITEIGMASLLPKAHESSKVVAVGGGKLGLEIDGKVIKDRKDRVAFLRDHAGVTVFDAKLDDLLPKPSKKIKDGIQNAELILITSQEIDELGEQDNLAQARLQIDGVLSHLRRGVRVLANHGIKNIVLVADHGHLFADEMGEDMKIEAPGGKVEDLHRRVWVGVGGTSEPSYLRTSLASLGVDSEFDIATPWTFAVFKSKGGGRAYFHGGLSPQELIVPVVILRSEAKLVTTSSSIQWTLIPGTAKLTTRFFSVQVAGIQNQGSLFGFEPPTVRVELRANKKCVSLPVSASYGFEDATGEVKLKTSDKDSKRIETNTVTVMLTEEISQKTVGVYLLDAITGTELSAPLMIDVAISM